MVTLSNKLSWDGYIIKKHVLFEWFKDRLEGQRLT